MAAGCPWRSILNGWVPWQAGYRLEPQNEPYLPVRFAVSEPHTGQAMMLDTRRS